MVVFRVSSVALSVAFTMNESWTVRVGIDLNSIYSSLKYLLITVI